MRRIGAVFVFFAIGATTVAAQERHGHSPYAGEEARQIASLSAQDLEELTRGGGWGLARPAELNGVPGPTHLLELREALGLSEDQVAAIEAVRVRMQAEAVEAGLRFIEAERALDAAFRAGVPDRASLNVLVAAAGEARAALRLVHLAAHLEMPPVLTAEQIAHYNKLRGYGADPCSRVPDGHDPELWRRHNNCG